MSKVYLPDRLYHVDFTSTCPIEQKGDRALPSTDVMLGKWALWGCLAVVVQATSDGMYEAGSTNGQNHLLLQKGINEQPVIPRPAATFTTHHYTQPLDHFDNSTKATFPQRYFLTKDALAINTLPRTSDGRVVVPVILYDGGETSIDNRKNVLHHGVVQMLSEATQGVGIVLEHRYYGTSQPVLSEIGNTSDWGVDQLRWLNNRQSLEDSARFIREARLEGVPDDAVRRVIYYGASYAGGRAAFMRTHYPHLVYGAIASSAVVAATVDLPQYYYAIAQGAEPVCIQALQRAVAAADEILAPTGLPNTTQIDALRSLLGLPGLDLDDVAGVLAEPLEHFQKLSWLHELHETTWGRFCTALVNTTLAHEVRRAHKTEVMALGTAAVSDALLSLLAFVRETVVIPCTKVSDVLTCFHTPASAERQDNGTLTDSKAWRFQVCTEWGYFQTAPPPPDVARAQPSGPKIVSSRLNHHVMRKQLCNDGFTPGYYMTMPSEPDVSQTNVYGATSIAMDRLAFINGEQDPWRPMTMHSFEYAYGGTRENTLDRPFWLIPDCWHHCDSDGLADSHKEPLRIRAVHEAMRTFVRHWLAQPL